MSKSTIFSFRHPPDRNCQINQYHFSGVLGRWIAQGFKGLAKKNCEAVEIYKDQDNKLIFDESIQVHPKAQVVHKGSNPHVDSYSAFFDNQKLSKTCLEELIRKGTVMENCDFHEFKMSIFWPKILKIVLSTHLSGRRKWRTSTSVALQQMSV